MRSDSQHVRGFAPKETTQIPKLSAERASIDLISAVTNQGTVRCRVLRGTMNGTILVDFMKRLIIDAKRKMFLILENLRGNHLKIVGHWLAEHKDKIEAFYLPDYSTELNPDEYPHFDLKASVHGGLPARSKDQLKAKAFAHLGKLQELPA